MAYAFVEDVAASWEHYERFAAAFDEPPDGLLLHVAGPTDEGYRIIGVWESEAHRDRFRARHLGAEPERIGTVRSTVRLLRAAHVVHGSGRQVHEDGPEPSRPGRPLTDTSKSTSDQGRSE